MWIERLRWDGTLPVSVARPAPVHEQRQVGTHVGQFVYSRASLFCKTWACRQRIKSCQHLGTQKELILIDRSWANLIWFGRVTDMVIRVTALTREGGIKYIGSIGWFKVQTRDNNNSENFTDIKKDKRISPNKFPSSYWHALWHWILRWVLNEFDVYVIMKIDDWCLYNLYSMKINNWLNWLMNE